MYSCNANVDTWVKSHFDDIQTITLQEWEMLEDSLQRPVYRALATDKKIFLWIKKLDNLKQLEWNENELSHIENLKTFIIEHPAFFSQEKLSDQQLDELDAFAYRWIKTAQEDLEWSNSLIYAISMDLHTVSNKDGNLNKRNKTKSNTRSANDGCDCNTTSVITCVETPLSCIKNGCSETNKGCGFVWQFVCDGECLGLEHFLGQRKNAVGAECP